VTELPAATAPRPIREGDLLWTPSPRRVADAKLTTFLAWLAERGRRFEDYASLWQWSVEDLAGFWSAVWDYTGLVGRRGAAVVSDDPMPSTTWFPGARVNYAAQVLARRDDHPALIFVSERTRYELSYAELADRVARIAAGLRRLGVGQGDRVAGYLTNAPDTVAAFLATASLGAIWTCCSPDFGAQSVLDRFRQVDPVVLLAVPGYQYNGVWHDRTGVVEDLRAALGSLRATVSVTNPDDPTPAGPDGTLAWDEFLALDAPAPTLEFAWVPFDHPLWVVYTSGTTGLPKSIVHSHGGVALELLKFNTLHLDLGPEDRFFWFTTTGWIMWNISMGGLLLGATVVCYDGNPAYPSLERLWDLVDEEALTYFGTSAAFLHNCLRAGLDPGATRSFAALRGLGSTGSPLSVEGFAWVYDHVKADLHLGSISGGTDVATSFLGCVPTMPVHAGELQSALLGVQARALDPTGAPLVDQVGELVIGAPMPSMPVGFWNDADGQRYHDAYFSTYPAQWRHGDWVKQTARRSWVVYGRSDATLNRGGIRMGTAEFYAVLDTFAELADSLVIDTTMAGADHGHLVLLLSPAPGREVADLDDDVCKRIAGALRTTLSPRHVPDTVLAVARLPRTLNGKRLEVPVKKIFLGTDPARAADPSSVNDPAALAALGEVAARWRATDA
jgi:acetoacetyl-CoA synthetase